MSQHTRAPRRAGAPKGPVPDRCRRTPRDHTCEGRVVPRYYRVLRPPSQPLQRRRSTSAPSQNTHASSPRAHRTRPGAPPAGWSVGGGSLARARGPPRTRGQTWACTAPGSHPTATASARAPALGGHGGHVPPRGATPDRVKCTERGRARAARAVPRYYQVLRPQSQPLQASSAPRGCSALGARAGPRGARECRQHSQGGRGGTWGWPSGQGSTGKMCPPLDEL